MPGLRKLLREIREFQATGVISKAKDATKAKSDLPAAISHTETVGVEVTAEVPREYLFW